MAKTSKKITLDLFLKNLSPAQRLHAEEHLRKRRTKAEEAERKKRQEAAEAESIRQQKAVSPENWHRRMSQSAPRSSRLNTGFFYVLVF